MKPADIQSITHESDYDQTIIDMAHAYGWKCAHFRKARTLKGWTTAVAGDGKGWPDWIFAKADRPLVIVEGKTAKGRITPEQKAWIDLLNQTYTGANGILCFLLRWPDDLDKLEEILR